TLTPPASGAHAAVEEPPQAVQVSSAPPAKSGGTVASNWVTPVPAMEIINAIDPPDEPWLKDHRGIDVLVALAELVPAPTTGSNRIAGTVAGSATVSVRTYSGHVLTFQPATSPMEKGERFSAGEQIGTVGPGGHCERSCLHIGAWPASTDQRYTDPGKLFG